MTVSAPIIGITCDCDHPGRRARAFAYTAYIDAVARAGGVPVLIPPVAADAKRYLSMIDGLMLTGGDDPRTEAFGHPTHPSATPVADRRQESDLALLRACDLAPEMPVLGICLGMQLMALHHGGRLNQRLEEGWPTAGDHYDREHEVVFESGARGWSPARSIVYSKHRQGVEDAGRLRVLGRATDGLIEAVHDPGRALYLGVQWHPERTEHAPMGDALFAALVKAAHQRRPSESFTPSVA